MAALRHLFASGVLGLAVVVGSGCASQSYHEESTATRPEAVPSDAVVSSTGTAYVKFTPVERGRVYIYDHTADKLLYEGDVMPGQLVEVDAPHNKIMVGGKVVSERDLKPGHDKEVYFRPDTATATVVRERTVRYEDADRASLPSDLPRDASLAMTGTSHLRFETPNDGRVFIYDRTAKKVLYDGAVRRGEVVEVDAPHNRILVGGRVVSEHDLKPGHDKELYFRPETAPTGAAGTVEERTVIREKVIEK
jgi:hypothetical protein